MPVRVQPITELDIAAVAELLHFNLNRRMSPDEWARSIRAPWKADAPNYGFLLRDENAVVGAYLAFYSERTVDGRPERLCNLGPWCVLPGFRLHSLRLLKALLAQEGYHFTDLSPGGRVMALNERLNFQYLNTTTALIPHLPWPTLWRRRTTISCDPVVVERTLTGPDLTIYQDHVDAPATRHLVLQSGDRWCYVMFRKDRRKSLRRLVFLVSILYVSDPSLYHQMLRPLARHLLLRHGALGSLAELRVIEHQPSLSTLRYEFRQKMFKSPYLAPEHIDNLYSELACVPW